METKKWYESLTIDAVLVGVVLSILRIFGVDVGAWMAESEAIASAVNGAIGVAIAVLAIWGRVRAYKKPTL